MHTYATGLTLGTSVEHRKLAIAPPMLGGDMFTRRAPRLCSVDIYTGLDTVVSRVSHMSVVPKTTDPKLAKPDQGRPVKISDVARCAS